MSTKTKNKKRPLDVMNIREEKKKIAVRDLSNYINLRFTSCSDFALSWETEIIKGKGKVKKEKKVCLSGSPFKCL